MSHLRREGDGALPEPDVVSPAVTQAPPGDRRTPPAAERVFAELAAPWDMQLRALEGALAELEEVQAASRRLVNVRSRIVQARRTHQLAEQDLQEIQVHRQRAMSRAEAEADEGRFGRKRKIEDAKAEAAALHDARYGKTVRLTQSRLVAANRQLQELRKEEAELLATPLVVDPATQAWVEDVAAAVAATLDRDKEMRRTSLEPWTRLRSIDVRIVERLRETGDDVLPGQAFGEGPIHLVAGSRLALVEVRHGRDGVRVDREGDVPRLFQVRPDQDLPLGLSTGSVRTLVESASLVGDLMGKTPATIVCISAWTQEPVEQDGLHLCGPVTLPEVLASLEPTDVSVEELRVAARTLAARPLPTIEDTSVPGLDHLATIHVEEVPEGLPLTRDLIVYAQESGHHQL